MKRITGPLRNKVWCQVYHPTGGTFIALNASSQLVHDVKSRLRARTIGDMRVQVYSHFTDHTQFTDL